MLFTNARTSSSNASRSRADADWSPRNDAVERRNEDRANSISSSCMVCCYTTRVRINVLAQRVQGLAYLAPCTRRLSDLREVDQELLMRVRHPIFSSRKTRAACRMRNYANRENITS